MTRRKAESERKRMGRPPTGRARLKMVLGLRGTMEWRVALEDWSIRLGLGSSSEVIDQALDLLAIEKGLPPLPGRTGEDVAGTQPESRNPSGD